MKACFLKILHIADGIAETICNVILSCVQKTNIQLFDVTTFGSDRANAMTGAVTGMATHLKKGESQSTINVLH